MREPLKVCIVRCRDWQFPWQVWKVNPHMQKTVDGRLDYYLSGHKTVEEAERSAKRYGYIITKRVTEDMVKR